MDAAPHGTIDPYSQKSFWHEAYDKNYEYLKFLGIFFQIVKADANLLIFFFFEKNIFKASYSFTDQETGPWTKSDLAPLYVFQQQNL